MKDFSPIPPAKVPAETVERLTPRRFHKPDIGDVLVVRESSKAVNWLSMPRYRLIVEGEPREKNRIFARYEAVAAQAEELAARRRVRLFYVEDGAPALLMDYRTGDGH